MHSSVYDTIFCSASSLFFEQSDAIWSSPAAEAHEGSIGTARRADILADNFWFACLAASANRNSLANSDSLSTWKALNS